MDSGHPGGETIRTRTGRRLLAPLTIVAPLTVVALLAGLMVAAPASAQQAPPDVTAPTVPVVELLGDVPVGGESVTVRFTSTDADSGLDGFRYGINEEVPRHFIAAPAAAGVPGSAEIVVTAPLAGGRTTIFVWAVDVAGNTSNRALLSFLSQPGELPPPPPPPIHVAGWPLAGGTQDVIGDHHLTLTGVEGVDYIWGLDQHCFPARALELTGSGASYAASETAVIATSDSFSVAAWVRLDASGSGDRTVLSQSGVIRPAMYLETTAESGWRFALPPRSPHRPGGIVETAPGTASPEVWHHVAGVYDATAAQLLLYVNGELAATGEPAASPWRARGPFTFGAASTALGRISNPLSGSLATVGVWASPLDAVTIRNLGAGGGLGFPCF